MKKLAIICLSLSIFACNSGRKNDKNLPDSAGTINNLTIVAPDDIWSGEIGDSVREIFASPIYGLPQEEPQYTLRQMLPKAFHEYVKKNRAYVEIVRGKDKQKGIEFIRDVYASPQLAIKVSGKNNNEIISVLKENQKAMRDSVKLMELGRKIEQLNENPLESDAIADNFNIDLSVLFSYRIAKDKDNFMWLRKEIKNGDMNLLIYELPYNRIKNDSSTITSIYKTRDSIGQAHIPGHSEGMYMITEKAFAPFIDKKTQVNEYNAMESRGLWEVKNDYMAGPFLHYVINDKKNNRQLVLEGFTYAPNVNKRDFMFELEAIIKSLKIK